MWERVMGRGKCGHDDVDARLGVGLAGVGQQIRYRADDDGVPWEHSEPDGSAYSIL
jgi:hypothetical protein